MLLIHNKEHFDEVVEGRAVIQFGASWCRQCLPVTKLLCRLQEEHGHEVKFAKVELDDHFELAEKHKVASLPTVILFINGEEKGRLVGAKSSEEYKQFVTNN